MKFSYDLEKLKHELNPIYIKLMEKIQLSANADKRCSGKVEVTEILKPFNHITLDKKYKIIAYSSYEIHGAFGKVVAVEKNIETPEVYLEHEYSLFQRIIPDVCYPVNEVIFCDGTPEGFFEVIILNDIFWRLFKGYTEVYLDNYIFSYDDIDNKKEFLLEPLEWMPQYCKNHNGISKLLIFEKSYEQGIELCEYSFSNENPRLWQKDKEYSHIEFEKNRFSADKCCCCFLRKSICICG